jgi:hypothetical protein
MSDAAVSDLILEMENYLKETEMPDSDYIAGWHARFRCAADAAAAAGHGPDWQGVVERAHALGEAFQSRIGDLGYEHEQIKRELNVQALGQRALKGYSSSIR